LQKQSARKVKMSQLQPIARVMNASGCHCQTKTQLDSLVAYGLTTIVTKTCTLKPNKGNQEPSFIEITRDISINCLGMPNMGYLYYRDLMLEYYIRGITYIISLDASNFDDLLEMLLDYDSFLTQLKKDSQIPKDTLAYVEINCSCPSTSAARILSYDPLEFARLLENIKNANLVNLILGYKLSPYVDKSLLEAISLLLIKYVTDARIAYIVACNSIPNGMIINAQTGKPVLSNKTGGISGKANKLLGISNVWQFNQIFKKAKQEYQLECQNDIIIIGCGGIETQDDISDYIAAGASKVQIGHSLYTGGVEILESLLNSTIEIKSKL